MDGGIVSRYADAEHRNTQHYCPCSMAPWCPACRGLQPIWDEFGGWSEDLDIGVGQVDVTSSPGLSGRFMVTALPTIFQ